MGSFSAKLFILLTQNNFVIKESFDAANIFREIPAGLFDKGYVFASFHKESLSKNVPLERTINIILERVYSRKLVTSQLKKRILKN